MRIGRREALAAGAALGLATMLDADFVEAQAKAPPGHSPLDPMTLVDPELREVILRTPWLGNNSFVLTETSLPEMRGIADQRSAPLSTSVKVEERMIPGPAQAPAVRIFVINQQSGSTPRPAILYIHGGGYVAGRAQTEVPQLQKIAQDHDCVIVNVDYRLAPETRFPGSLEDNYAALKWLFTNAEQLGVDNRRIAIMGGSAGGGHAAMLAIAARNRGEVPILFQLLEFPMLDDRTGSTNQPPSHIGTIGWTRSYNRFGWSALLGVPAGSRSVPRGAVPAREPDLSGLPPTFIGVGSLDLFVGEDIDYARRLVLAGVPTELLVLPGAFHGFRGFAPDAAVSRTMRAAMDAALAKAFKSAASSK